MKIRNHLAELRKKRGFSAAELAKQIGVSRQTIYAMENGTYVPNTAVALRLAQVLEARVEEMFRLEDTQVAGRQREVELLPRDPVPVPGQPVQLCQVGRKLVASAPASLPWSLPPADGVVIDAAPKQSETSVELFQDDEPLDNRVLIAGCDPGTAVLARHLRRAGVELVIAHRNSSQALELLKLGWVHVAGSHLRDEETGESNLPAIRRLFTKGSVAVITFAIWEEGIVVAKGNPRGIQHIEDLAESDAVLVNREPGSGSRSLLDSTLKRAGIEPAQISGYDRIAHGHLPAAWEVRSGMADCCIATRAAALVFGLDFVSLVSERYDLVIRQQSMKDSSVQLLLETLDRTAFRRELELLGGYDVSCSGRRVA